MTAKLRIIYMGTPEFAVGGLKALVDNGFDVIAVVTAPDKPSGRGLHVQQSPVKQFAVAKAIPVLQPIKLKDPEFIASLQLFKADLQVVVAFRMLPEIVWHMPRLGTLNLHASLLPDYRGAAPINHAIINGEVITGVTTFFLQHAIDTGDIIFKEPVKIAADDNAGTLHDKLMAVGAQLIVKTVQSIADNNYKTTPQSGTSSKTAPKIFKETCAINWHQSGTIINNFIRGLSPYPGAHTIINGKMVKIYEAFPEFTSHDAEVGAFESDNAKYLKFATTDGFIHVTSLQIEGKKRMNIEEFLRGNKLL